MDSLTEYCFPGTRNSEQMIPVTRSVSLRLITFTPPARHHPTPIICVPGLVTQISCWKDILTDLTRDHVVHYLETREKNSAMIRGHADYSLATLTGDLTAVLSHLRLTNGRYVLFGSSLGANIILEACRHPGVNPLALALIGPNSEFHVPLFWKSVVSVYPVRLYPLFKPVIKWYYRTFRVDTDRDPVQYQKYCNEVETSDPSKLKRIITAFQPYDIWPLLREVQCPALVIGATSDRLHDPHISRKIASHLPNASYVELETNTVAHGLPAARELRKFLDQLAG